MKIFLSALSALLLIGCGGSDDTADTKTSAPTAQKQEAPKAQTAPAPTPVPAPAPAQEPAQPAPQAAAEPQPVNGMMLFKQKCATCHGQNAQKQALNTSQIIAGWEASRVEAALKGYQAGTYGGTMKGMMQGQAKPLTDAQIAALADFVSKQ